MRPRGRPSIYQKDARLAGSLFLLLERHPTMLFHTRFFSRRAIVAALGAASLLLAAACQHEDGLTTVPVTPPVNPADSVFRAFWQVPTAASFASDTLRLIVRGPRDLRQGRLTLRNPISNAVLVEGPVLSLRGRQDTIVFPLALATTLISGQAIEVTGEIRTADNSVMFTSSDSSLTLLSEERGGAATRFFSGKGITLEGNTIGGMAVDPLRGWLILTLAERNELRVLNAGSQGLLPWKVTTGATPGAVYYHPSAWGPGGTAVVVNTGGTDLSVVDLETGGGSERLRRSLPSLVYRFGGDTTVLAPRVLRATIACTTDPCALPQVLLSLGTPTGRAGMVLFQPAFAEIQGAILPEFSGQAPDSPIDASLTGQLVAGSQSPLATSSSVSRCSGDRLGSAWFGQSQRSGAPSGLIVVSPDIPATCAGTGRLQVWEPVAGSWRPNTAVSSLSAGENMVPQSGIRDVVISDDGARIAVVASDRVAVFRSSGGHIGNLSTSAGSSATFLHDEFGAPVSIVVLQNGRIEFRNPTTLAIQATVIPPPGFDRDVRVVPSGGSQFLLVASGGAPARLWMLPMNTLSLSAKLTNPSLTSEQ